MMNIDDDDDDEDPAAADEYNEDDIIFSYSSNYFLLETEFKGTKQCQLDVYIL